jgi:hypothetical protein
LKTISAFPEVRRVEACEPDADYDGPDFSTALDEDGLIDAEAALDILKAYEASRAK